MDKFFKKLFSILLLTILCISVVSVSGETLTSEPVKAENVYSNKGDVFVSGKLKTGTKTSTVMAVKKNVKWDLLTEKDIYYVDELKSSDGEFAFKFHVDSAIDGFDTYIYNGETGIAKLNDYTDFMYIAADMDVKTYAESLDYDINVAFNNIFGYDVGDIKVYTAVYDENNMLLNVLLPDIYFDSDNEAKVNIRLELEQLTDRASYVKLFAWNDMKPLTDDTKVADRLNVDEYTKITDDAFYGIDSDEIYYGGRWLKDDENKVMISNWQRPYVRVKLTYTEGQTVKFRFKKSSTAVMWYVNGKFNESDKIPNDSKTYQARCSLGHAWNNDPSDSDYTLIDVTKALSEGMNEIIFMVDQETAQAEFSGIKISGVTADSPMYVYKPNEKPLKMMIIGDSITSAGSGYAVMTPMILDADFVNVSRSAIALRDGKSYFGSDGAKYGMESRFDFYESVGAANEPNGETPFNFEDDDCDIICVNLGTNDRLTGGADSDDSKDFISRYKSFISKIHDKYPEAEIVVIRPFNGGDEATDSRKTENANRSDIFAKMKNDGAFDAEYIHYWDTSDLDLPYINNPSKSDVALHPTYIGHQMITKELVKFLSNEGLVEECDVDNVNFDDLQASAHYGAAYQG